jgi:hypothetical protein
MRTNGVVRVATESSWCGSGLSDSHGAQHQARDQAAALARQQFEAAVVGAGDALDDGEPEAGAGGVAARGFEAGEGTLDAFDILRGNAGAAVAHLDQKLAGGGAELQLDRVSLPA